MKDSLGEMAVNKSEDFLDNISSVAYICSKEYLRFCDQAVKVRFRASATHSLIKSYGLLKFMTIISPSPATENDLLEFHSQDYINFLKRINDVEDHDEVNDELSDFGIGYDCPLRIGLYNYISEIAGATITASQCLIDEKFKIAINWGGGWHHAKKDEAAGFCYVNDIVLAILKLRNKFERVLYVDLDVHHGDGVEDAFGYTSKVMTVSFHKLEPGFYPGTGHLTDIGYGKGKYFTVNVPLKEGIQDKSFCHLFEKIMDGVKKHFKPLAVVCQCGADCLAGDPMNSFNLTPESLGFCTKYILQWNVPTLFLGGGGYNIPNTAKCWTYLTSIITRTDLSQDIPDNPFFTWFGPDFVLNITAGLKIDRNTQEYIDKIISSILGKAIYRILNYSDSRTCQVKFANQSKFLDFFQEFNSVRS